MVRTKFLFLDVMGFNENTDMLHVSVPMQQEDDTVPSGSANDDLDSDDSQIALHLFQVLVGSTLDGEEMVGQRFTISVRV